MTQVNDIYKALTAFPLTVEDVDGMKYYSLNQSTPLFALYTPDEDTLKFVTFDNQYSITLSKTYDLTNDIFDYRDVIDIISFHLDFYALEIPKVDAISLLDINTVNLIAYANGTWKKINKSDQDIIHSLDTSIIFIEDNLAYLNGKYFPSKEDAIDFYKNNDNK